MHSRHALPVLTCALAITILSACSEGTGNGSGSGSGSGSSNASSVDAKAVADEEKENDSRAIPMTETGWLSVGRDGSVQTTFFDSGGRYRDFRNGELWGEGGWEQRPDGSVCFEPDTGAGACWETGEPEEDGSIIITDEDGAKVEIQRVTYIAPETGDEAG